MTCFLRVATCLRKGKSREAPHRRDDHSGTDVLRSGVSGCGLIRFLCRCRNGYDGRRFERCGFGGNRRNGGRWRSLAASSRWYRRLSGHGRVGTARMGADGFDRMHCRGHRMHDSQPRHFSRTCAASDCSINRYSFAADLDGRVDAGVPSATASQTGLLRGVSVTLVPLLQTRLLAGRSWLYDVAHVAS